jgi:hypothetical protein
MFITAVIFRNKNREEVAQVLTQRRGRARLVVKIGAQPSFRRKFAARPPSGTAHSIRRSADLRVTHSVTRVLPESDIGIIQEERYTAGPDQARIAVLE